MFYIYSEMMTGEDEKKEILWIEGTQVPASFYFFCNTPKERSEK